MWTFETGEWNKLFISNGDSDNSAAVVNTNVTNITPIVTTKHQVFERSIVNQIDHSDHFFFSFQMWHKWRVNRGSSSEVRKTSRCHVVYCGHVVALTYEHYYRGSWNTPGGEKRRIRHVYTGYNRTYQGRREGSTAQIWQCGIQVSETKGTVPAEEGYMWLRLRLCAAGNYFDDSGDGALHGQSVHQVWYPVSTH